MKKTIILLSLLFAFSATFAQKGKVTSAENLKDAGKIQEALEAINEALDPSNEKAVKKSIPWPKTWEVRGAIYQAIAQSKDPKVKSLSEDPLSEALESYKKALELDTKGRNSNSVKIQLTLLTNDLTNQGVKAFQDEDYKKALKSFEQILDIQDIDVVKADNPEAIDTVIIFNTGLAAYNAQEYDKAIKYYSEAAKHGYSGARSYGLVAQAYQAKKDTLGALEALKEGFEKYPEDNLVLESLIQIYMDLDKSDEAMKYLDMAIQRDPTVPRYLFAQGALYEKLNNEEKAIETYSKAIEVDPEYFDAYYNLGALYYNKGVKQMEIAKEVPASDNARYEAESAKADIWFEKALPYMEKCHELRPEDKMSLESLKNLYYRMKQMDKYNEVIEKLGQ